MGFADYDDYYRKSRGRQFNTFVPPPGDYQVKITGFKAIDGATPRVKFFLEPLYGEFAGMAFEHVQFVRGLESVDYIKGDIEALGEKIDGLSDLSVVGERFIGMIAEVTIKEKRGKDGRFFKNIYINRRLTEVDDQGMPMASESEKAVDDQNGGEGYDSPPAEASPSNSASSSPGDFSDDDIPF
jgi:hypothetical protein